MMHLPNIGWKQTNTSWRIGSRYVWPFVSALTLVLAACSDLGIDATDIDGFYNGTFAFTESNGHTETGSVIFTFEGNRYSCTPQRRYLPPGGAGVFIRSGRKVTLKDTVGHTAEFDWTLILYGEFFVTYDGSHLVLRQNDVQSQRYRVIDLTRQ